MIHESTVKKLVLSGDIELNPGPVTNPCSVCERSVASKHRAIQCDSCEKWCHIGTKYRDLISQENFDWICPVCTNYLILVETLQNNNFVNNYTTDLGDNALNSIPQVGLTEDVDRRIPK
jgi:hypothetical protein